MDTVMSNWLPLPGGELEALRPSALCPDCRAGAAKRLCLLCFRAGRARERRIAAARDFDAASVERFQESLPFEPVDDVRLARLRAAREAERADARRGTGQYVDRRRQAQIAARHALQRLGEGLRARGMVVSSGPAPRSRVNGGARPADGGVTGNVRTAASAR